MRNTGRQLPKLKCSQRTSAGAMAAPTAEPLSKSATARPRSLFGNHSETALVAPGQLAASPLPNRNRKKAKLRSPTANDVNMAATEYQITLNCKPRRVPNLSSSRPATDCITA